MSFGFRKPLDRCTEQMRHSSIRPGMSMHVTQFTRPSPTLVLQATNTGVRRPGYEAVTCMLVLIKELWTIVYMYTLCRSSNAYTQYKVPTYKEPYLLISQCRERAPTPHNHLSFLYSVKVCLNNYVFLTRCNQDCVGSTVWKCKAWEQKETVLSAQPKAQWII